MLRNFISHTLCRIAHPSLFSGCDMEPVLENMNLSYLAQNHSSMTRLKEFVYRCQMYNITES